MGMKVTSQCHPLGVKCFCQVVKSIPKCHDSTEGLSASQAWNNIRKAA
jgi:hypothetical protein